MVNLLKSEWYKLRKDQMFRVLAGTLIFFSVSYPLTLLGRRGVEYDPNIFYIGQILSINLEVLFRIVPCILAGFFISSEYSMGTMKSMVSSGHNRNRIYVAKLMVYTVGVMILSLILPVIMTGASAIYLGSNVLPELAYFFQTTGMIALFAAGFAAIMSFFAVIFTDSGKTIGFLVVFMLLSGTILQMLGQRFTFFEPISDYSVFNLLLEIYDVNQVDGGRLLAMIIVPIVTFMVFGILGIVVFRRKEIK